MSDAIFCDNCNAVARRGDVISRRWIEVLRVGEPRQTGRRLLPASRRIDADDPLGGGRHFCSLSCAQEWMIDRIDPAVDAAAPVSLPVAAVAAVHQDDAVDAEGAADAVPRADDADVDDELEPAAAAAADAEPVPGDGPRRLSDVLAGVTPTSSLSDIAAQSNGDRRKISGRFRREPTRPASGS